MKIKKQIISIITAGVCAFSALSSGILPCVAAYASSSALKMTFDKKHYLEEYVSGDDLFTNNTEEVREKLSRELEYACRKYYYNITYGDLQNVSYLDLSGLGLRDLPRCIQYMTNLRSLDLSHNLLMSENLTGLNLSALTKLVSVNLGYNYLTSAPSWYVSDNISTRSIIMNLLSTDSQRFLLAGTPVYYFMKGERININELKNRILADIRLSDGSSLPDFLYDPDVPTYDISGSETPADPILYPLHIEDFDLSGAVDQTGKVTLTEKFALKEVTVRLFNDTSNANTKAKIRIYFLDGSNPSTVKARLKTTLDEAGTLVAENYTAKSWANLDATLKTSQAIYDYPSADSAMLKTALEQLSSARDSLIDGIDPDTLKVLTDLTAVGGTYVEADYTPLSWQALKTAVDEMKRISADKNETRAAAKGAISAFQAAQSGLQKSKLSTPAVIPKASFEKIFGESMSVSATGNTRNGRKYSWKFAGRDLTNPIDFNPAITDSPADEDKILIECGQAGGYVAFSTNQTADFPGTGILTLDVSDKFEDGTYFLYEWAGEGKCLGEVPVKDGKAELPISKGGTYYVSPILQKFPLSSSFVTLDHEKNTVLVPTGKGYSVKDFRTIFKYGTNVGVYDAEGRRLGDSSRVRTGNTVAALGGKKYTITVMGDVNDDGYVNTKDALEIFRYSMDMMTKPKNEDKKPEQTPEQTPENTNTNNNNNNTNNNNTTGTNGQGAGTLGVNGNPEATTGADTPAEKVFGVGVTGINVADVNYDGKVNLADAVVILKAVTGSKK